MSLVRDRDGREYQIVRRLPATDERGEQAVVRLDDGREMVIPIEMLSANAAGHHDLALSGAALLDGEERVIPVVEEALDVHKRAVETGRVRVRKVVHEHEETIDEPLMQETVEIRRVTVDRMVERVPPIRQEGDTIIVPLVEEVLVVEKRLILKEEVHLVRHRSETRDPQRITLRREEAIVERRPPE